MTRLLRALTYLVIPAIVFGLSQLHGSVLAPDSYTFVRTGRLAWATAYAVLLLLSCYVVGLPGAARTLRSGVMLAAAAVAVAASGISFVQLAVGDALLPRFVVFGSALAIVPAVALSSWLHRRGFDRNGARDRIVVVSSEGDRLRLEHELDAEPERPAVVVGWCDPEAHAETELARSVEQQVRGSDATVLVLDLRSQTMPQIVAAAADLHEAGIRIRTLSLFYEEWLGKLPVSELERVSLLFDVGELHRAQYARAKRVVDVLVASVGLVVLVASIPVVCAGNLIANRGPLFFRQERVGKGGVRFTMVKFRTMRPGLDEVWTTKADPRVTSFGRLLRRTHTDELPQMLNILRGDLSLVGPRPEQPHYVEELSEKLPFYGVRHLVRPGLTGWAQVKYGYASDEADALEKLQYEFYYLRRQGLALDLRIIGRTPRSMVRRGGR